jgi:hypothetical protein
VNQLGSPSERQKEIENSVLNVVAEKPRADSICIFHFSYQDMHA